MANDVLWSAIYLGNFADIDTNEGNDSTENEALFLGTHGSTGSPLWTQRVTLDTDSPNNTIDRDDFDNDGTITYDVGSGATTQIMDSIVVYNSTITYTDGTTATSSIGLIQMQNGDAFFTLLDGRSALYAKPIREVNLTSVDKDDYNFYYQDGFDDDQFICFAAGTLIRTPAGDVPVETLRPDDPIQTLDHGTRPLLWQGARRLRFAQRDHSHKPYVFRAGCLGPNLPTQDLIVSPQHCLLSDTPDGERLARAKSFAPLQGVRQMKGKREVTYHSLLFDRHEVIFANGVPAESLYPGPYAMSLLTPLQRLQIIACLPGVLSDLVVAMGKPARETISHRIALTFAEAGKLHVPIPRNPKRAAQSSREICTTCRTKSAERKNISKNSRPATH